MADGSAAPDDHYADLNDPFWQPNPVKVAAPLQKCPVCDGTGLVSRPPGVAGDQTTWVSTTTGPYRCRVCEGQGIVRDQ